MNKADQERIDFLKRLRNTPIELQFGATHSYPVSVSIGWLPTAHYKELLIHYTRFIHDNLTKIKSIHILEWEN